MTSRVLLYGATGFTGRMLAQSMRAEGYDLVLAGRDGAALAPLADDLGLPFRVFRLTPDQPIDLALTDIEVVLHAAGPFVDTASPMMTACIRSGVHYLDIAGEWPVFLEAAARSPAAAAAGVMVMPGVGFTLVASDCLMALAVARTPDTEKLRVGLSRPLVMTRGTVRTSGGMFDPSVFVRRGGALCAVPAGELLHDFDFGQGLTGATAVSMPDVVTGQVTTGVADIEFYAQANWASRLAYRWCAKTAPWTDRRAWELMSRAVSLGWPEAPSAEALQSAGYVLVVEAVDRWRRSTRLRMRTMDGYSVTVLTAGEIVRRVLNGSWAAGFQTPAGLFGGDLILGLGCAVLE